MVDREPGSDTFFGQDPTEADPTLRRFYQAGLILSRAIAEISLREAIGQLDPEVSDILDRVMGHLRELYFLDKLGGVDVESIGSTQEQVIPDPSQKDVNTASGGESVPALGVGAAEHVSDRTVITSLREFKEMVHWDDYQEAIKEPLKIVVGGHIIDMRYFPEQRARFYAILSLLPRTHALDLEVAQKLFGHQDMKVNRNAWYALGDVLDETHSTAGRSQDTVMRHYLPDAKNRKIVYLEAPATPPNSPYISIPDDPPPDGICMDEDTKFERKFYFAKQIEVCGDTVRVDNFGNNTSITYYFAKLAYLSNNAPDDAGRVFTPKRLMDEIVSAFSVSQGARRKFIENTETKIKIKNHGLTAYYKVVPGPTLSMGHLRMFASSDEEAQRYLQAYLESIEYYERG